jgi:hypothetical protein
LSNDEFSDVKTSVSSSVEIAELLESLKGSPDAKLSPDGAKAFEASQKLAAISKVIRQWAKKELKFDLPKKIDESSVSKARAIAALDQIEQIIKQRKEIL